MDKLKSEAKGLSIGRDKEYRPIIEQLYAGLPAELRDSPVGKEIEDYLFPVKKYHVGDVLPDYMYVDRLGGVRHLSEFRGKRVLVDFWSMGCMPCIQSIPVLQKIYDECGDEISIISISLDTDSLWERARKEHPVSWTEWRDPSGNAGSIRSFDSRGIPTFVLVSPEGIIMDVIEGLNEEKLNGLRKKISSK